MKYLLTILFLFPLLLNAQTVRTVAASGADYTSIAAAIAAASAGDTIRPLETIYESVTANKSVVLSGGGITGFQTKTSWTNVSGNIWETDCTSPDVTQVFIDNVKYNRGKTGYYAAESYTDYTVTNSSLDSATNDYEGAEIIFAQEEWIRKKFKITGHNGTTLTVALDGGLWGGVYGLYNAAPFFMQNDRRFCTSFGDWYYNRTTGKLGINFGGNNPSAYTIKVAELSNGITIAANNVTLHNITIDGFNYNAVENPSYSGLQVINSTIRNVGRYGVENAGASLTVTNNTFSNIHTTGVRTHDANTATINANTLTNIATIAGEANVNGDWTSIAIIAYEGTGITITQNNITNVGYNGILFYKTPGIQITYNNIKNTCLEKLDGAGVYCVGVSDSTYHPAAMYVKHNISSGGNAHGYYLGR